MRLKSTAMVLSAALGLHAASAHAWISWQKPAAPSTAKASAAPASGVTLIGSPEATDASGPTSGHNATMAQVMDLLLPTGWAWKPIGTLPSTRVSWKSDSWVDALREFAAASGFIYVIDTHTKTVSVQYVTPAAKQATPKLVVKKPAKLDQIIPQSWELHSGDTVKKDLEAWAAKAGWSLVWSLSKDWVIPATSTFNGSFQDAAASVVSTLSSNGAIIHAKFFRGNRTVVITGAPE